MTGEDDAVRRVFGLAAPDAPVHAVNEGPGWTQAWCGVQPQFRHRTRPGDASEVTCPRCLSALRRGRPYARGSR